MNKNMEKVEKLLNDIVLTENYTSRGYVELGIALYDIHKNLDWKDAGYKSFGAYIDLLSSMKGYSRSQIYNYFSTVRELVNHTSSNDLVAMGISKAHELAKSVKRTGSAPKKEIIDKARQDATTAAELRKILAQQDNVPPQESGTWLDQKGFYVNEDEKLVIQSADELALRIDPAVQGDAPDWVRRKEARLRQAMEFLATHGGK